MDDLETRAAAWQAEPTPEGLAPIVSELEPTINAEVQRFSGPKPLLRAKAKTLAIKAVRTWKPEHQTRLRSWVVTQLQPLSRYGQQLRPVHVSEMAIRQAAEINRVRQELSDELGREPEPEELSDQLGIPVRRIQKLQQTVKPTLNESSFTDEEGASLLPTTSTPNKLNTVEDAVYQSLNTRDKAIFDWKTGKHGKAPLSNQEIARRLGVTPGAVSQRTQQIALQIQDLTARGIL